MRAVLLVTTILLATMTAGCTVSNSPGGQTISTGQTLSYNGASTGSHKSNGFDCDGSGSISVQYNIGSGSVTVNMLDPNGVSRWTGTYSNAGQGSDTQSFSGAEGQWTIEANRAGSFGTFSGQYQISADC